MRDNSSFVQPGHVELHGAPPARGGSRALAEIVTSSKRLKEAHMHTIAERLLSGAGNVLVVCEGDYLGVFRCAIWRERAPW